jgi:anti-sigma regulatory factor (Ser/Thr protein kinase)
MNQVSTMWNYDLDLPAEASSASKARQFVDLRLAEHDVSQLSPDVQLVVSELATNAFTHALTPFTVTLAAIEHSVLLTVRDGSPCHPVVLACGNPLDTDGRGITIVALLSHDWGVTAHADGGKTVWATFDA